MTTTQDVLFSELDGVGGHLGVITLNRPMVLNALNHEMVQAIHARLKTWAEASHIKGVVICAAEGRAFCAGGDLRSTYERYRSGDPVLLNFFHDEYQLNKFIFHFPKPYIALLDGITMGGGVGLSIHGSHRVVTDRVSFAMPETGIGFFPDIGGTYFLPRLPGKMGLFLGLTGTRINYDDCMGLGIATHHVEHDALPALMRGLRQEAFGEDKQTAVCSVSAIINQFSAPTPVSGLMQYKELIDTCFAPDSVEGILQILTSSSEPSCHETAILLQKKSPTSLKVTFRVLTSGLQQDFDTCMQQESNLAGHFLQGHDFSEGIRAVIIDKDQAPNWQPATLREVTPQVVDPYFSIASNKRFSNQS